MADQADAPVPKTKPGSLRDRIAAFEKAGASTPSQAPPPPRPKPAGFASWKPKQPSPPSSPPAVDNEASSSKPAAGGMSVNDAKDSIVKGGSLKDRMAALQGKGAFGAAPPVAPKPSLEKPKWKPPPVVSPPIDEDDDQTSLEGAAHVPQARSPPPRRVSVQSDIGETRDQEGQVHSGGSQDEDRAGEPDPEEEERQRRAAIAARLARLGGTRVGMAPVFGKPAPPPPAKKPSLPPVAKEEEKRQPVTEPISSPPLPLSDEPKVETEGILIVEAPLVSSPPEVSVVTKALETKTEALETAPEGTSSIDSTGSRSPPSMPVPAMPRRAAPPRKKATPKAPAQSPPAAGAEAQDTPASVPTISGGTTEAPNEIESADVEPSHPTKMEEGTEVAVPPTEKAASPVEGTISPQSEATPRPVEEGPARLETDKSPISEAHVPVKALEFAQPEEEEDETRRKEAADRIARMGGVNPFAIPPARRDSASSLPLTSPPPLPDISELPPLPKSPSPVPEVEHTPLASVIQPKEGEEAQTVSIQEVEEPLPHPAAEPARDETEDTKGSILSASSKLPPQAPSTPQVEDDNSKSEYDGDESPDVEALPSSKPSRVELPKPEKDPEEESIPMPPPRRTSIPPRATDAKEPISEVESDYSDDEVNSNLVRSQILERPTSSMEAEDEEQTAPPPPRRTSADYAVPPRRNVPLPPPSPPAEDDESLGDADSQPRSPDRRSILGQTEGRGQDDVTFSAAPILVSTRASPSPPPPPSRATRPGREIPNPDTLAVSSGQEILDEDEGDPIDPSFFTPSRGPSRRTSTVFQPAPPEVQQLQLPTEIPPPREPPPVARDTQEDEAPEGEDAEAARRRTIADRMARLGGIKFGAVPPMPQRVARPPPPNPIEDDSHAQAVQSEVAEKPELTEEEEERARKERIAAKLAGMGGMRIGMLPPAFPTQKSSAATSEQQEPVPKSPPPPSRASTARPPPSPAKDSGSEHESIATSDEGVKVEADEDSEMEEVGYEEVQPEPVAPPPPPSRGVRQTRRQSSDITPNSPPMPAARPPVPTGLPPRRMSGQFTPTPRRASSEVPAAEKVLMARGQSDYVMVEEPETEEIPPPLPSNRPGGRAPQPCRPPPPPQAEKEDSISSQWELPNIPTATLNFGGDDLSMSWTEAEASVPLSESITLVPSPNDAQRTPRLESSAPPARAVSELQLSADDLMVVWGRVGVQVCEVATALYDKSKRGLVGDGTYPGFVHAVLNEVPNAAREGGDWGYLVYKQTAGSVQKRASDIMPGDIFEVVDGKFKGHKGIHAYHQNVGVQEPLVGVVSEVEVKKSKIRVFQANQNVGQQTVESASYRLEDLKSGTIKVYRVLEA